MFDHFMRWLDEIDTDIQVERYSRKLGDIRIALIHLHHQRDKILMDLGKINVAIHNHLVEYSDTDSEKALIDGRYKVILKLKPEKKPKKTGSLKTALEKISRKERKKLLEELLNMT